MLAMSTTAACTGGLVWIGHADDMYRWPWLEAKIRRQPWIGLVVLVCLIMLCAWILVSASHDRSPQSGLPMGLIAVVVLRSDWLAPWSVLIAALLFTLAATALVVGVLWRMFWPLRQAADGLRGFMTHGTLPRASAGSSDEVGRLVGILVRSLAHLDRSRSPAFMPHSSPSEEQPQDLLSVL